ncbi:MAG: 4a-hydroxytetrahydrobiopterin dehydratase [Candidatus Woykebacteria bacterium]
MENLANKKCVPCEGGVPSLKDEEVKEFITKVVGWNLEEEDGHKQISKTFKFKNFRESLDFVNTVGKIAEGEGHHPDIHIHYNRVTLVNYTHAISGLHENDFILAAKIDEIKA